MAAQMAGVVIGHLEMLPRVSERKPSLEDELQKELTGMNDPGRQRGQVGVVLGHLARGRFAQYVMDVPGHDRKTGRRDLDV